MRPPFLHLWLLVLLVLGSSAAHAKLTSVFDAMLGPAVYKVEGGGTQFSIEAPLGIECNYNLNYENWRTAFSLVFSEALTSNQGDMAITRFGLGAKYFVLGFPSERLVIDSRTEGRIWRSSPFVGLSAGMSNFTVARIDASGRFFNAVAIDVQLKLGVEVPINPQWILLGQATLSSSISSASEESKAFSYFGAGMLVGFKMTAF